MGEDVVARAPSVDFFKRAACILQVREHKFFGQRAVGGGRCRKRPIQCIVGALDERNVPDIGD